MFPRTVEKANYRPTKKRRQNKIPFPRKPRAYVDCSGLDSLCPICSEISRMYCRKCGDTTCHDCRDTNPEAMCGCHFSYICSIEGDARPMCLRLEQGTALRCYNGPHEAEVRASSPGANMGSRKSNTRKSLDISLRRGEATPPRRLS